MTAPAAPRTAGELLEAGACSVRCLLARTSGPCGCPCGGRWHGALASAAVGEGALPGERGTTA